MTFYATLEACVLGIVLTVFWEGITVFITLAFVNAFVYTYTIVQMARVFITVQFSWAYGKAGNGNEMETGNGNWKRKPETKNRNGNKKRTNHWCNIFFIVWQAVLQCSLVHI